jgi:hypothetical protein
MTSLLLHPPSQLPARTVEMDAQGGLGTTQQRRGLGLGQSDEVVRADCHPLLAGQSVHELQDSDALHHVVLR